MIDMHFDLLSIIYQAYLRIDYSFVFDWLNNYNRDNVSGLIANLYFLDKEKMKEELGNNYDSIDVVDIFKKTVDICKKYFPYNNVLYSIEGCDYIKDENELEELYNLGLRSLLLVWNNPNKYASGNLGEYGLTDEGKRFLIKAIDLGIIIDVSHMNKATFYDVIELLKIQKKLGKKIKVIASHSNCYKVYAHYRNLDDEQLLALKEFDPIIGINLYTGFVADNNDLTINMKDIFLRHVKHVVELLGIEHVGIASNDMTFNSILFNCEIKPQLFDYRNLNEELTKLLSTSFDEVEVEKILYKNVYEKLFKEEEI